MIIFAAGNKYKMYMNQKPVLVHDNYFVYAFKWIKSKNGFKPIPSTYNIGHGYEVVEE